MFRLILLVSFWLIGSGLGFASSDETIDHSLKALYTFRYQKEGAFLDKLRVQIILTFANYFGSHTVREVFFKTERKYKIFVAVDETLKPVKTFDVYFGGGSAQYAVFVDGLIDPFVGVIGETSKKKDIEVYAGLRGDPTFFDNEGFITFIKDLCRPVAGIRCSGNGEPANSFARANVGMIAIDLPLKFIDETFEENKGNLYVWAKVFKKKT